MKIFRHALIWFFFLLGWLLVLSAVPTLSEMAREERYQSYMDKTYDIYRHDFLSEVEREQEYHGVKINTYYINESEETEVTPSNYHVKRADVVVEINGEAVTTIEGTDVYPDLLEMEAFRKTVQYYLVENLETGKEELAIAIETTKQNPRDSGIQITGMTFDEDSSFRVFLIDEDGNISKEDFTLATKNKLQTQLIRDLTYSWHGYTSDLPYMMPNPLLPIQLVGGGLMIILSGIILIYPVLKRKIPSSRN
ncbi:hypothetical protein ACOJQI_21290 [Bacillus salacetis]|uniref:hypothetical protein n=1 Tax=Bacillus salacetis TaxID=2315464 RepID=UPI003BA35D96